MESCEREDIPGEDAGALRAQLDAARRRVNELEVSLGDVEELREALRRSEERFGNLVKATSECIFEYGTDLRFTFLSQGFKDLLGYEPEEFLGQQPYGFMSPEEIERIAPVFVPIIEAGLPVIAVEQTCLHKDGHEVIVEVSAHPTHDRHGNFAGYLGIVRDITERKLAERRLTELATTDSLTGANNRRQFMSLMGKELARMQRHGHDAAYLQMDIDFFKAINDAHGHHIGDEVLRSMTRTALEVLREGDLFGRIGGEEFAALLVQTDVAKASHVAERLRLAMAGDQVRLDGTEVAYTVSIGVAGCQDGAYSAEAIIKRADQALYAAKRNGRNRVCLHGVQS